MSSIDAYSEKYTGLIGKLRKLYNSSGGIIVMFDQGLDWLLLYDELYVSVTDRHGREFVGRVANLMIKTFTSAFIIAHPRDMDAVEARFAPPEKIVFFCELNRGKDGKTRILVC